jgi:hypothetical protein
MQNSGRSGRRAGDKNVSLPLAFDFIKRVQSRK